MFVNVAQRECLYPTHTAPLPDKSRDMRRSGAAPASCRPVPASKSESVPHRFLRQLLNGKFIVSDDWVTGEHLLLFLSLHAHVGLRRSVLGEPAARG